jgi:hypothetical protein
MHHAFPIVNFDERNFGNLRICSLQHPERGHLGRARISSGAAYEDYIKRGAVQGAQDRVRIGVTRNHLKPMVLQSPGQKLIFYWF